jgi:hypothetical protein
MVNDAVRIALAEDATDLESFKERQDEKSISFETQSKKWRVISPPRRSRLLGRAIMRPRPRAATAFQPLLLIAVVLLTSAVVAVARRNVKPLRV